MIAFTFHFNDGEQFEAQVCKEFINFVGDMQHFDSQKFICGRIFEIRDNTNPIQDTDREKSLLNKTPVLTKSMNFGQFGYLGSYLYKRFLN